MNPNWIVAVATAAYTIASVFYVVAAFLMWSATRNSLETARSLFKLNLLVEYYRTQQPAPNVGHGWETREVPQKLEELRKRQAAAMRRVFPELELDT